MKRRLFCILALTLAIGCWATPRSEEQALAIAYRTLATQSTLGMRRAPSSALSLTVAARSTAYYAVNAGSGFVLVSADDALPEVLGYSDNGAFDEDNLPPAFRYWLESYDADAAECAAAGRSAASVSVVFPDECAPLLPCKWNQSSPFNDLAPMYNEKNHAAAGCVATAMAQIMYAYRYPERGTGSHSYTWVSLNDPTLSATLSVDFGATIYDWASMLDSYSGSSVSAASRAAVATLLYHCGVAVDMGYDCNKSHESGAITSKVPAALASYFGYDTRYQSIAKDIYPVDSLNRIIHDELNLGHPILVSGSNASGGHAFVCDGYNRMGYFHINWGWGGSSDGYYLLSALNPGTQGIGGSGSGYNKNTVFYVGIRPSETTPAFYPSQMAADSFCVDASTLTRTGKFTTRAYHVCNRGMDDYSGKYGVALYDEDETTMVALLSSTSFSLSSGYYRISAVSTSGLQIPASVPAGTYHLCIVYEDAHYGWLRMLCRYDDYYKTVYVSDAAIEFMDNNAPPLLSLTAPIVFSDVVDSVPRVGAPLEFSIYNGGGTFRGDISARIYQGNFARGQYEIMDSVLLRRDQLYESALQQTFDAKLKIGTTYKMKLCWRADPSDFWHEFTPAEYATLTFRIYDPPAAPDSIPSVLPQQSADSNTILSKQLLMHLPTGDLYMITVQNNNTIQRYKIILSK